MANDSTSAAPGDKPNSSSLASTPITVDDARENIHLRHVEQLRLLQVPALGEGLTSFEQAQSGALLLPTATIESTTGTLEDWSTDSQDAIKRAVQSCARAESPTSIDWNVATLAIMASAAMYLRDDSKVVKAQQAALAGDTSGALSHLKESQHHIGAVAALWEHMEFVTFCDLVEDAPKGHPFLSGPFCGAYYYKGGAGVIPDPFIVVAFKGTTFTQVNEWLLDLDFWPMTPPSEILFNDQVSKGVYTGLFTPFSSAGGDNLNAYDLIVSALEDLSVSLGSNLKPVPVYITGHSLGASYATLLYAQMIYKGRTSYKYTTLCDMHNFGSPRMNLTPLASDLRAALGASPTSQHCHTWRIVNSQDIVTTMPPMDMVVTVFAHIDQGILISSSAPPQMLPSEIDQSSLPGLRIGSFADHSTKAYYKAVKNSLTSNTVVQMSNL